MVKYVFFFRFRGLNGRFRPKLLFKMCFYISIRAAGFKIGVNESGRRTAVFNSVWRELICEM